MPRDAADHCRVLAHQRVNVLTGPPVGERLGVGERLLHGFRAHAASACGAPITATTSTDFSSGTSKKLITGVSGRQVLTSLRIARRIEGWTTSAKGLASATSG